MKVLLSRFFILAVLFCTLVTLDGRAQQQTMQVEFTAPASFVAGDSTFPAGTYMLRQQEDDVLVWEISSNSKSYDGFIMVDPVYSDTPHAKSEVIFNKYANVLFLKQIWVAGHDTGYVAISSYAEKKAAKSGKPTKVSTPAEKK